MMRIDISRDLSVKLESFTFKYRFSALPYNEPDSRHSWHSFVYTDEDLNSKAQLVFRGNVPSKMKLEGCCAYVSEVRLSSGQTISYSLSDFSDSLEDEFSELERLVKNQPLADVSRPKQTVNSAPTEPAPASSHESVGSVRPKKRRLSTGKLTVVLTVIFFSMIIEAIAGVYIFNYTDAKKAANQLMEEARWNEAYKLILDKGYNGLLQQICERASVWFADEGDLESSYVYACAAPEKFPDKIIAYAAESVIDAATGEINENAYRVAKMASDDGKFSDIVHSMISMLEKKEDYPNALRVASELRGANDRDRAEQTIFSDAIKYYLSEHRFESLVSFIGELKNVRTFSVTDTEIAEAISSYAKQSNDSSGLIYFSTLYPELIDLQSVDVSIKNDDSGVHSALGVIWELLDTDQKRDYHNRKLAISKELFVIDGGWIDGYDVSDAVSVATNEFHTLILHKSGRVSLISTRYDLGETLPDTDDIIQIDAGKKHSVMLHANGTVSAAGDNSYGQCEVASWTNIAAIAAGDYFTIGLKTDGTLVACGSNSAGQCNVQSYNNVAAIAAGAQTTVLLFSDKTVKLIGYRSFGLAEAEDQTNVTRIRAGGTTVVLEKKDGSFALFDGSQSGDPGSIGEWKDITDFAVGVSCIAAIDADGRLFTSGSCVPHTDIMQS